MSANFTNQAPEPRQNLDQKALFERGVRSIALLRLKQEDFGTQERPILALTVEHCKELQELGAKVLCIFERLGRPVRRDRMRRFLKFLAKSEKI